MYTGYVLYLMIFVLCHLLASSRSLKCLVFSYFFTRLQKFGSQSYFIKFNWVSYIFICKVWQLCGETTLLKSWGLYPEKSVISDSVLVSTSVEVFYFSALNFSRSSRLKKCGYSTSQEFQLILCCSCYLS